jgi:hypothetical protein
VREFPLSSSMWWSSWSASIGVFFLDFFYGGIVSCLSVEITVGANVGGEKIGWDPERRWRDLRRNLRKCSGAQRQGISESLCLPQKLRTRLHVPSNPIL